MIETLFYTNKTPKDDHGSLRQHKVTLMGNKIKTESYW
jgi:hypothetical protein